MTSQKEAGRRSTGSHAPVSRVSTPGSGSTARDDRLIRRPNAAHALRAHVAEVLDASPRFTPDIAMGGQLIEVKARTDPGGPSRKARDIVAGVRTRAPGYAHLFDPVAPTSQARVLLDASGAVRPVLGAADLGVLVREARETLGQSQTVFASGAGVGRRFLSELEAGKPTLEIGKVLAVCQAAGVLVLAGLAHGG